jgi:zinc protease
MKTSAQEPVSGMRVQTGLKVLVASLATALAAQSLHAQQSKPWEKIPIPPLHQFKPHQPTRIQLKNGIILFLQEDHELPFVNGSVLIPGGSRDESAEKAGLVDLYGQAWRTSGSEKMDGDAMDDFLEAKAAHIETGGDIDSTALSWDSLKGDADQVYALAMDLLFHPKFSQEKLQLAKQQEATGIVRRNDDEGQIAERESVKLVYGANSPYTRQPELATVGAVTLADLNAWHDRTLKGKLIVAISGDFDPAAMEAKLRATFEPLAPVKPLPAHREVFHDPARSLYFINKDDVNQSNIQIVGLGTDRGHEPGSRGRLWQQALSESPHRTRPRVCCGRRPRLRLRSSRHISCRGAHQKLFDRGRNQGCPRRNSRPDRETRH